MARVKLVPDAAAYRALADTLALCNQTATAVSRVAQDRQIFSGWDLRKVCYGMAKGAGLSAQPAQNVIRKVVDAYKTRAGNARRGRYGTTDSGRYRRIMENPVTFRPDAAQPYDDRCLSWNHEQHTVSIWTVAGRLKTVTFIGKRRHMRNIAAHRHGETDLVRVDGTFYLVATLDEDEPTPSCPNGFLGVDLGEANLAVTSDGQAHGSDHQLRKLRTRHIDERRGLQARGTKSAKKKLKRRSGRESRRMTDVNHCISKHVVAQAQRTGRGIALEDLVGIRDRARHRRSDRAVFHSWAFAQLAAFIVYKARWAGVDVQIVDARYTSQTCSACGYRHKRNRPNQETFTCRCCGTMMHADHNAAINIAARGQQDHDLEVALAPAA